MKTMTGFDTKNPKFNATKYIRQLRGVRHWIESGARGTLEYATGVGKTTCALIVIAKMMQWDPSKLSHANSVLVVVPTTNLKNQWKKLLDLAGFSHVEVQVINTVSLSDGFTRNVDLLIIDEVHLMAAPKFKQIFARVKYSWVLGLTATLERLDGMESIINAHAPVCDVITQREAIDRGWIADFIEFNLAVPITKKEAAEQVSLGKEIRSYMSRFKDFNHMLSCMDSENATRYAQQYNAKRAQMYAANPKMKQEPPITSGQVIGWARNGMDKIHIRKNFLDTTEHKIEAAVELIKEFGVRTITFSQSTVFATEIANRLGKNICRPYHVKIPSEIRNVRKKKEYKTEKGAEKYKTKLEEQGFKPYIKPKGNLWYVYWSIPKNFSGKKIAEENFEAFVANKFPVLAAAKAVDQGTDIPDVLLGVDGSRSESTTQHTQRTGRIGREFILSDGTSAIKVYVNLYIPDWSVPNSRDEQKLKQAQSKNPDKVIHVDSLDELKDMLHKIIKQRGENSSKNEASDDIAGGGVESHVEGENHHIDG